MYFVTLCRATFRIVDSNALTQGRTSRNRSDLKLKDTFPLGLTKWASLNRAEKPIDYSTENSEEPGRRDKPLSRQDLAKIGRGQLLFQSPTDPDLSQ